MESMNCQSCQATLLPISTEPTQLVRCGGCGNTFLPVLSDQGAIQKTDRMAKWSFWLGLASLVLCMVTGIPALILGLRSLRRMRFRVVQKREKFQAVTGTILGLVFGVIGGGCLTASGLVIGLFVSSFEVTKEAERVVVIAEKTADFDNTLDLKPLRAISFLVFKSFQYGDRPNDDEEDNVRLTALEFHYQPDARNPSRILRDEFIGDNKSDFELAASDELDWQVVGSNVTRELFESEANPEKQVIRYTVLRKDNYSWFGATIVHDPALSGLEEEDIKRLMQSLKPKIFEGIELEPEE
jgi:hypothetical protein